MIKKTIALLGAALLVAGSASGQGSDDCSSPQAISGLGPHSYDNTSATTDGPQDCDGKLAHRDVWFRWQAPQTGGYIFTNCADTNISTRVVAYDDQSCPVTNPISCSSSGCIPMGSQFSFDTTAGQFYLIRVGSRFPNDSGDGSFTFVYDPCPLIPDDPFEDNDSCDTAVALDVGTYMDLKVSLDDQDWFAFDVADGATIQIDNLFTDADGNIETFLYLACNETFVSNGGTTTDNEVVMWTNTTGACVRTVFQVGLFQDAINQCNTYTMVVQGASPPGTCGPANIGTNYCGPAVNNSTGNPGIIEAIGSTFVTDNDVTLTAFQLPNNQFGYFLTSMDQGFIMNPGGSDGNLCLSMSIGRYNRPGEVLSSGGGGEFSLVIDLTDTPQPNGPVAIMGGETWNFTSWYRDAMGSSNFTDGIEIQFQ